MSTCQHPDQAVLDEIVRRIVAVAQPERIILFASAARGKMSRHSDLDLLEVKDGVHRGDMTDNIYRHLRGLEAAIDVTVVTPDDVELPEQSRIGDQACVARRESDLCRLSVTLPTIRANG